MLTLILLAGLSAPPTIADGWDWTLPASVTATPYSGFITWQAKRFDPSITVRGLSVRWRELNPAPGVFDWAPLTDAIAASRRDGMRLGIHLKGSEAHGVPEWVIAESGAPVLDMPLLQENQPWRLQNVPPWHPGVDRRFHEFLTAFGETGLAQSDDIVYAYIHGISPSRGEELFLRPVDVELFEREAGLTPEVLLDWITRRTEAMLRVFAGAEGKLAWMAGGAFVWNPPAYRAVTAETWRPAVDGGAGVRGGGIDFMHQPVENPAWGLSWVDGYQVVDDTHPTIVENRFRGDENEEYGQGWEWRFGPADEHAYRHRIVWLRALALRQNFQLVSPATLALNPELNHYVLLSQGKRRDESVDAFAYLREGYRRGPQPRPLKNVERWLIQRDVPGSVSQPTERVDRAPLPSDQPEVHFDYDARRTDLAAGQDGLAFQLDRVFWPTSAPAEVKVTYVDRAETTWRLVTVDRAGHRQASELVSGRGDGVRRTATFSVADLAASGDWPGEMDFRLEVTGPGDLVVNMVRVIRAVD